MTHRKRKAASVSGGVLAARAKLTRPFAHPHLTPFCLSCQGVFAKILRLLAEIAKRHRCYALFCWLRRKFLLNQAAVYSKRRHELGGAR